MSKISKQNLHQLCGLEPVPNLSDADLDVADLALATVFRNRPVELAFFEGEYEDDDETPEFCMLFDDRESALDFAVTAFECGMRIEMVLGRHAFASFFMREEPTPTLEIGMNDVELCVYLFDEPKGDDQGSTLLPGFGGVHLFSYAPDAVYPADAAYWEFLDNVAMCAARAEAQFIHDIRQRTAEGRV